MSRVVELGPERKRLNEGWISLFASRHQQEPYPSAGCTCGFVVWSGEHVAVMAYREACERLGIQP